MFQIHYRPGVARVAAALALAVALSLGIAQAGEGPVKLDARFSQSVVKAV